MDTHRIIKDIVTKVKDVKGITAIVLGGSRARGTHSIDSDIDIGIYYSSEKDLDLSELQKVATDLDDNHREEVLTDIGEWGTWINGGGWLKVDNIPVDFLYRDLNKVSNIMNQCLRGEISIEYYPGHPHGFINAIYFSEISLCKILWDPDGVISRMKAQVKPYPTSLKRAIIGKFFWEATFSLDAARKGHAKGDISYTSGCCFRSISCVNQALFAVNECYWMNEKGAVNIADSFSISPSEYKSKVNNIFNLISSHPEKAISALEMLEAIIRDTEKLIEKYSY